MYELWNAIRAEHHFDGNTYPWYIGSPHADSRHSDNYWQSISWGEHFVGETHSGGGLGEAVTVYKTYGRKYVATETRPDGTIVVHGNRVPSILPVEVWRNNPHALEKALERAYNSPGNYTYTLTSFLPGMGNA